MWNSSCSFTKRTEKPWLAKWFKKSWISKSYLKKVGLAQKWAKKRFGLAQKWG